MVGSILPQDVDVQWVQSVPHKLVKNLCGLIVLSTKWEVEEILSRREMGCLLLSLQ